MYINIYYYFFYHFLKRPDFQKQYISSYDYVFLFFQSFLLFWVCQSEEVWSMSVRAGPQSSCVWSMVSPAHLFCGLGQTRTCPCRREIGWWKHAMDVWGWSMWRGTWWERTAAKRLLTTAWTSNADRLRCSSTWSVSVSGIKHSFGVGNCFDMIVRQTAKARSCYIKMIYK